MAILRRCGVPEGERNEALAGNCRTLFGLASVSMPQTCAPMHIPRGGGAAF